MYGRLLLLDMQQVPAPMVRLLLFAIRKGIVVKDRALTTQR
jgi:hypothetical protein